MSYWSQPRQGGRIASDQHLLYAELKALEPELDDIPSFAIVRHPLRRFVSEWKWQRWEMRMTTCTLGKFVDRVEQSLAENPVYWDNHWRPQTDFLSDQIDRVIRLEEINAEFPKLLKALRLDLPPELPRINPSSGNALRKLRQTFQRSVLRDSEVQRLRGIYANDFTTLGYA